MRDDLIPSRFLTADLDQVPDAGLLALLMNYSVEDPYHTAQDLLSQFQSLANLLDSTTKELQAKTTLSKKDIGLIRLVTEITRRYYLQRCTVGECLGTNISLQKYIVRNFLNRKNPPGLYILCTSNVRNLEAVHLAIPGNASILDLTPRMVASIALRHKGLHLFIANYRPDMPIELDPREVAHFDFLHNSLTDLGLELQEGFLFTDTNFLTYREMMC